MICWVYSFRSDSERLYENYSMKNIVNMKNRLWVCSHSQNLCWLCLFVRWNFLFEYIWVIYEVSESICANKSLTYHVSKPQTGMFKKKIESGCWLKLISHLYIFKFYFWLFLHLKEIVWACSCENGLNQMKVGVIQ